MIWLTDLHSSPSSTGWVGIIVGIGGFVTWLLVEKMQVPVPTVSVTHSVHGFTVSETLFGFMAMPLEHDYRAIIGWCNSVVGHNLTRHFATNWCCGLDRQLSFEWFGLAILLGANLRDKFALGVFHIF